MTLTSLDQPNNVSLLSASPHHPCCMLLLPNRSCIALSLFLFHLFTLFSSPLPILTILCLKRGCWLVVNSVTASENLDFRIKLGSIRLLFTLCRSFLILHLAAASVVSRTMLPGWLLLGISDLSSGAHSLPGLKLLTSCLNLGHKLDQGFYFPCYQEEPECGWFCDAPGFFSHLGSSFSVCSCLPEYSPVTLFLQLKYSSVSASAAMSALFSFYEAHHSLHVRSCLTLWKKRD